MKNTRFIVFLFIALGYNRMLNAQVFSCDCGQVRLSKVTAPSGLVLREQPSKSSKKILAIPLNELVTVCEVYFPVPVQENIEGIGWGQWERVMYKGKEGYVFDYYLDKNALVEVFHADAIDLPPNLPNPIMAVGTARPEITNSSSLKMTPAELKYELSRHGDTIFYFDKKLQEESSFFISGIKTKQERFYGYLCKEYHGDVILPGTYRPLEINENKRYALYATGEVIIENSKVAGFTYQGPPLVIKNYKIYLQDLSSPDAAPQLLVSKNKINLGAPAYGSGLSAFHFAGDLDGDNKLDVLLNESGDRYTSVMLFLSSKAEPGFLLKLIRKMIQACC